MPLSFPGKTARDPDRGAISIQATDARTGNAVVVRASDEALEDHGLARVKQVASAKYDNGEKEPDGSVFVRTADC